MEKLVVNKAVYLAVLPFENFTPDNELDYLARGFAEDLITDLSRFQSLMVISSHSVLQQGMQDRKLISEKLGANYLLKGNFRYRNEKVRIVIQLVDAENQHIIWAERYDEPLETIFEIHDDIIERVVGVLSSKIDIDLLSIAQKKSFTQLQAYDCWLRGMEHMKQASSESDQKARAFFQKALEIDPLYARAYTGISLTYFNNWSCMLWNDWEDNEKGAFENAVKAVSLDESDHISQMVLGRILNYRKEFEQAEYHLNRSLTINPNDADNLVQLALCFAQVGSHELGIKLFNKALRLNPYHDTWYYAFGMVPYFLGKQYLETIGTGIKCPIYVAVDQPAFLSASYAYEGDPKMAWLYLNTFLKLFKERIKHGKEYKALEALEWMLMVTPCKKSEDTENIVRGLELAGLKEASYAQPGTYESFSRPEPVLQQNVFRKEHELWEIAFMGQSVILADVKGFHDLLALLLRQGEEIHCTALMQSESQSEEEAVFDDKAKHNYRKRIQALQEELAEAEEMQHYEQAEKLSLELDQLIEHVSKATGLGGKTRKVKSPVERSRAAVTLRIRSAIKKIAQSHPSLGKHFQNAIRTGTFCSYQPEQEMYWVL
jgi:TolB-like protein